MTNFLKNRWVQGLVAVAVLGAVVLVLQGDDETTVENVAETVEAEATDVNTVTTSGTTEDGETTEAVEVTTTEVETTEETTTDVTE